MDLFEERAKSLTPVKVESVDPFEQRAAQFSTAPQEGGIVPSFKRGLQSGVSGLLTGQQATPTPQDQPWLEHLAQLGGQLASDIPAMTAGSVGGTIAGAPLGPVGSLVGAGAGAFAAPTAIKEAFNEYRQFASHKKDLTFSQFLESAGNVAKQTGKSAMLGGAVGTVSKMLPALRAIPGMSKLLDTPYGQAAVKGGLELGTLTGGGALLEGKMPTVREAIDNGAMLLAAKGAHVIGGKVTPYKEAASSTLKSIPGMESLINLSDKLPTNRFIDKIKSLKQNADQKMYFDMLKDHVGERNARMVESQFKWRENLAEAEKEGKFTPQQLEDMMYYRQKTGSPFQKGDSYENLSKRLPDHAKKFVDETVHNHLEDMLKEWNDHPETKNITPREGMEDIYLPGLYEYDPKLFNRGMAEVSRKFKSKNPLSNAKVFMDYNEALIKRGLKPRYRNIVDLMKAYDSIMVRAMGNAELISKVKNMEKKSGEKIIVNSTNKKAYQEAKLAGFIPFDDPFLRRYVAGTKEEGQFERTGHKFTPGMANRSAYAGVLRPAEHGGKRIAGKPIMATTSAPALVHPDFADAFKGVFNKDAYKPESQAWKAYDTLGHKLRMVHVALSPFHYFALGEHGASTIGFKKSFQSMFKRWSGDTDALLNDKEFMQDAARSGLSLQHNIEGQKPEKSFVEKGIDKVAQYIPEKVKDSKVAQKGIEKLTNVQNHLFGEYRPRLKAATWKKFTDDYVNKRVVEGKPPSEQEMVQIKRDMATAVNDIFGGQNFETMRFVNDPNTQKWMRRMIGYPDWTVSAIRNGANAFSGGLKGEAARKVWLRYGINYLAIQGALSFSNGGWTNDKDGKPVWKLQNALDALNLAKRDPSAWYKFPLPDVNLTIAGHTYNPARDDKGKKLYAHTGKQFIELTQYLRHPINEAFSKSNPLIQSAYKQVMGSTPYEEGDYTVQGKYKYGERKPWEATEPWTPARWISRAKELGKDVLPYSISNITQKGVAPWAVTVGGGVPISGGMSLQKAVPYFEKAIKANDHQQISEISRHLRDNGYKAKQINRQISMIRSDIRKNK